jgi:hypothetical protein
MFRAGFLRSFLCLAFSALVALGAEFKTVSGDVYRGELASADKDGLIVRLVSGDFSPRIDWAKLTDDTLRELSENPKAKRFVEPFLEAPPEEIAIKEAKQIPVRPPARVPLPDVKKGLVSAITTPNGLILLGLLYLANLYSGYEIARFKWRPVALVCGVSAVLPVAGPVIFLLLHKVHTEAAPSATQTAAAQAQITAPINPLASGPTPGGGAAAALGIAKQQAAATGGSDLPKVFKRGEITFNRRFFETQFQSFFRVVPSEADKDLVIDVSAGKKSVIATRVSRISMNEVHFKTATNQEIGVPFAEISQVTLRHKDAGPA